MNAGGGPIKLGSVLEFDDIRIGISNFRVTFSDDGVDLALAFDATNVQQAQDFSIVFENIDLTKIGFLPQIDIDDSGSV